MGVNPSVPPKHFWCFHDYSGSGHDKPVTIMTHKNFKVQDMPYGTNCSCI